MNEGGRKKTFKKKTSLNPISGKLKKIIGQISMRATKIKKLLTFFKTEKKLIVALLLPP